MNTNKQMVSKSILAALSLSNSGSYFLRPDRILGCFLIDPFNPPSCASNAQGMVKALRGEEALDVATEVSNNNNYYYYYIKEREVCSIFFKG